MATHLQRWQQQIDQIKQELLALGDMRPGALSEQYNVCGKPNCRCKDPRKPQKHGPYYQLSYTHLVVRLRIDADNLALGRAVGYSGADARPTRC
jgi:hypothetical protein